jgi:hypothetical protein
VSSGSSLREIICPRYERGYEVLEKEMQVWLLVLRGVDGEEVDGSSC